MWCVYCPDIASFSPEHRKQMEMLATSKVPAIPNVKPPCLVTSWSAWASCRIQRFTLSAEGQNVLNESKQVLLGWMQSRSRQKVLYLAFLQAQPQLVSEASFDSAD